MLRGNEYTKCSSSASVEAYDKYSKYELQSITDAINGKLPREIRDMIWSLCWEDDLHQYDHINNERSWRVHDFNDDELTRYNILRGSDYQVGPHPRTAALRCYPWKYFARANYVGIQAAREAVEAFYRTAPAYVETLRTGPIIDYFEADEFDMDVAPQDFITSIVFFIQPCCIQVARNNYYDTVPRAVSRPYPTDEGFQAIFKPGRKVLPRVTFLLRHQQAPETL